MTPLQRCYLKVHAGLSKARVRFALAGGLASNLWVRSEDVRDTADIDIAVVAMYPDPASIAAVHLYKHGYTMDDVERWVEASLRRVEIRRIVVRNIPVDFILARNASFVRRAFRRAHAAYVGKTRVRVLSAEDVFLFKALAGRPKDIQPMWALSLRPRFDRRYVESWARTLGVWAFAKRTLARDKDVPWRAV